MALTRAISAKTLFPGEVSAPFLGLDAPLSFWGGVDRETGRVTNQRHPNHGAILGGRVVHLAEPIGSSSSAAVLLELISNGTAPAALILGEVDAILVVGCLAARELGETAPPVVLAPQFPALAPGTVVTIDAPDLGAPARVKIQPAAALREA